MRLSQNGGHVVASQELDSTVVMPGFVSLVICESYCLDGYKE